LGTDRSAELADDQEGETYCARHPQVVTYLRCGRCDTPICPRCLIQTPVGARCRDCANVTRLPTFDVSPAYFARGLGAAAVAGVLVGWVWSLVTAGVGLGLFIGIFIGMGIGWAISEIVSIATNRKRGLALQICVIAGVVIAFFVQEVFVDVPGLFESQVRTTQIIIAGIAAFFGASRIRAG
jgi:hypothetical protein